MTGPEPTGPGTPPGPTGPGTPARAGTPAGPTGAGAPAGPAEAGAPAGPAEAVAQAGADGAPAGADGEFAVAATVRLASAGLHVIDRWTDALLDALQDAGAGEPQVGGSLTGGRIEVHLTVGAAGVPDAAAAAAELLRGALAAAATPGIRVVGVRTDVRVSSAGPGPS